MLLQYYIKLCPVIIFPTQLRSTSTLGNITGAASASRISLDKGPLLLYAAPPPILIPILAESTQFHEAVTLAVIIFSNASGSSFAIASVAALRALSATNALLNRCDI